MGQHGTPRPSFNILSSSSCHKTIVSRRVMATVDEADTDFILAEIVSKEENRIRDSEIQECQNSPQILFALFLCLTARWQTVYPLAPANTARGRPRTSPNLDLYNSWSHHWHTVIITKCDSKMERGDYFQYPNTDQFNFPQGYNDEQDIAIKD